MPLATTTISYALPPRTSCSQLNATAFSAQLELSLDSTLAAMDSSISTTCSDGPTPKLDAVIKICKSQGPDFTCPELATMRSSLDAGAASNASMTTEALAAALPPGTDVQAVASGTTTQVGRAGGCWLPPLKVHAGAASGRRSLRWLLTQRPAPAADGASAATACSSPPPLCVYSLL
jgi:hypothetical protein